jgi:hypothetical protein
MFYSFPSIAIVLVFVASVFRFTFNSIKMIITHTFGSGYPVLSAIEAFFGYRLGGAPSDEPSEPYEITSNIVDCLG